MTDETLAVFGKSGAAAVADEHLAAQQFLKMLDARRNRSLGDVQAFSCRDETAATHYFKKSLGKIDIHISKIRICKRIKIHYCEYTASPKMID